MERWRAHAAEPAEAEREGKVRGRLRGRGPSLILYLDTSALIKLFIQERGTSEVQEAIEEADAVATSDLAYVETLSALARMRAGKRLTAANHRTKRREFEQFWSAVAGVDVSLELIERGGDLAERHALRAYDAVHLASALLVSEAGDVVFSCWDKELRAAAVGEGLELARM